MSSLADNTTADKPLTERVFRALCWSRAYQWRNGLIGEDHLGDEWIGYAVDPLVAWADRNGIDPDLAQQIIAAEFGEDAHG